MFRSLLAAVVVYTYGYPAFDGYRPAFLDKPLQGFHGEVNGAARDGERTLSMLDDARAMRYLNKYIERVDSQLRSGQLPLRGS